MVIFILQIVKLRHRTSSRDQDSNPVNLAPEPVPLTPDNVSRATLFPVPHSSPAWTVGMGLASAPTAQRGLPMPGEEAPVCKEMGE